MDGSAPQVMAGRTVDAGSSAPSASRRRHWKWWLAVVVGVVVVGMTATAAWAVTQQPFGQGSWAGFADDPAFARAVQDPLHSGTAWVYCAAAPGRFTWGTTIRNVGPVPVTLLGAVPPRKDFAGPQLLELAAARELTADGRPRVSNPMTDPATAPQLDHVDLAPGDEIEVWARYTFGDGPSVARGQYIFSTLPVRYSVLGLERRAEVALTDGVVVETPPCQFIPWGSGQQ